MTTGIVAAGKMTLMGPGVVSCGKFLTDVKLGTMYFLWAQGYMSALNLAYVGPETATDLSDAAGQESWLKNYCEENSLDLYIEAVQSLWIELRKKQRLEPDPRSFARKIVIQS